MYEQSKAAKRRFNDGAFHTRYFVGRGLDIGAGPDGLSRYRDIFPRVADIRDWDLPDGDAQFLASIPDGEYDFVHSSHSLEHMVDVRVALANWIRVVRPGGYLVIMVPDEDMYERGAWPSRHNADHKWTFTTYKRETWSPKSVNLVDLVREFGGAVELERLNVVRDFFRPDLPGDQTMTPVAECAIEIVLRKRPSDRAHGMWNTPLTRSLIPPSSTARLKACRRGVMLYDVADDVGRALDAYGEHGEATIDLFSKVLSAGDVALDVGAGIGALSVALAEIVGDTGLVHAFEPQERAWRRLVANVALNGHENVRSWMAGAGRIPGLVPAPGQPPAAASPTTIDSLALPRCRLIRVDLEGVETDVLAGAEKTIERCRPLLYLQAGRDAHDATLIDAVAALGYRMFWHIAPFCRVGNFFRRPIDAFKGVVTVNILAAPADFSVSGLPAVVSADWRADIAASVPVPA